MPYGRRDLILFPKHLHHRAVLTLASAVGASKVHELALGCDMHNITALPALMDIFTNESTVFTVSCHDGAGKLFFHTGDQVE